MFKKIIYCDYASATPLRKEVTRAMHQQEKFFANPSAKHFLGQQVRSLIEASRQSLAQTLNCLPAELIFTGSGTESINQAIIGGALANSSHGKQIITPAIEHQAVLQSCQELVRQGFEITYLPVEANGQVKVSELIKALTPATALVSLGLANNEIGTIQSLAELSKIIRQANPRTLIHTDACQCPGLMKLDLQQLDVDLLSLNACKISGPKGVGLLFARQGKGLRPIIFGGEQERNLRAGTENYLGIIGLDIALRLAQKEALKEAERLAILRDYFEQELVGEQIKRNSPQAQRLANNSNLQFVGYQAQQLLEYFSENGLCASAGSACQANSDSPSHVLIALGQSPAAASSGLRFSFGRQTTLKEIKRAIKIIKQALKVCPRSTV